jgi:hypothetical protein
VDGVEGGYDAGVAVGDGVDGECVFYVSIQLRMRELAGWVESIN